jgi:hypothetical protein
MELQQRMLHGITLLGRELDNNQKAPGRLLTILFP